MSTLLKILKSFVLYFLMTSLIYFKSLLTFLCHVHTENLKDILKKLFLSGICSSKAWQHQKYQYWWSSAKCGYFPFFIMHIWKFRLSKVEIQSQIGGKENCTCLKISLLELNHLKDIHAFENVPVSSVCTQMRTSELSFFYCNLWQGNPPALFQNVTFGVENTWALSVKFILPLFPHFLCNDMQEPGLMLGTHVLWICYISFMLFVVKSSKHFLCLRWSVQSIFFLLPPWLCVCVCVCAEVCVIFIFF